MLFALQKKERQSEVPKDIRSAPEKIKISTSVIIFVCIGLMVAINLIIASWINTDSEFSVVPATTSQQGSVSVVLEDEKVIFRQLLRNVQNKFKGIPLPTFIRGVQEVQEVQSEEQTTGLSTEEILKEVREGATDLSGV
jgi:uncharacterized membrane protein